MSDTLILESTNSVSDFYAALFDYSHSAWFMLFNSSGKVVGDVWVYNSVDPIDKAQVQSYRPDPPPAPKEFCSYANASDYIKQDLWEIIWGPDGVSACLTYSLEIIAVIESGSKIGFSKHLIKSGPWGNLLDDSVVSKFMV